MREISRLTSRAPYKGENCRRQICRGNDGRRLQMIREFRRPAAYRLAFIPAALAVAIGSVAAQEWPTRTIRMVVPLTAGSAVDIVPRIVLEQVSTQIGHTIVVDNRTGASG